MQAYISRTGKLRPSTCAAIKRHVEVTFETWADLPLISINAKMCRERYRELVTKGLRGNRPQGSPGQANQAFTILGALLAFAALEYLRKDDTAIFSRAPVDALKNHYIRLKERTRRIQDHKVGEVWSALTEWRAQTVRAEVLTGIELIRFLLLTVLRMGEASSLKWSQVELEHAYYHIPKPKNSNPVYLPLSTQALELLMERPRTSEYVFPSWSKSGHIVDPRDVLIKVSKVAGNTISPHDLRRSFTNVALRECRIDKYRVDLLTNHVLGDFTSKHYTDTTHLQWLKPEIQMVADYLDQQAASATGANVIPMRT